MSSQLNHKEKLEYLKALEHKQKLIEGLPFLYRWPWYQWAREFFESTNHLNFLCAGNQIGKSSTQIRKAIDWATNIKKWPTLWRTKPNQFWYLYPTQSVATIEFEEKWMTEQLPNGEYANHPVYGWKADYRNKQIFAVHFNSGVSIYFKTYAQDEQHLQSGSCHAIFCDEELPEHLFEELRFRLEATDGHFHMVCTPTMGQDKWRRTLEGKDESELFPNAWKRQVSMYDCMFYDDGTPSFWTVEKIKRAEAACRSNAEIQKRIYGKFTLDEGLKYPGFDIEKNVSAPHLLPSDWHIYSGVDLGGGGTGHPAAICFVAVNPTFTSGRVFLGWRGDGIDTTASDVLNKFVELRGNLKCVMQCYDWHSKDFSLIAARMGEVFVPADKSHERGEQILNVLFKQGMLKIQDTFELRKLMTELTSLLKATNKKDAKDDFTDALRYAVTQIPWDWSVVGVNQDGSTKVERPLTDIDIRRAQMVDEKDASDIFDVESELAEWNDLLEN